MDVRQDALQDIVDIASRHDITWRDIRGHLNRTTNNKQKLNITRLLAYVGGMFVFAGICIFTGLNWAGMNSAARIVITLGPGIATFVMALTALGDKRFSGVATPLFLISSCLQPTGIMVAFAELSSGGDGRYAVLTTSGVMLAQQLMTFLRLRHSSLLFSSLLFGMTFLIVICDLIGLGGRVTGLVTGAAVLCLSVATSKSPHSAIAPFWYAVSSALLLSSLFALVNTSALEVLFLGASCGLVYLSTHVRSRTLLFISTVSILGYIGYFTNRHFVDSIGWPIALILFGLAMIGLSAQALKINRKYIQSQS